MYLFAASPAQSPQKSLIDALSLVSVAKYLKATAAYTHIQPVHQCWMLLDILQLVLHGTAVTTIACTAPCDHRPIAQDGAKCNKGALDLSHVLQLALHGTAVTPSFCTAPCDDRPICQDGGKHPKSGGMDLLHVLQLVLNGPAVTTFARTAPCDDRPISQDGGKSTMGGLDLLHVLQLVLHNTAVTTEACISPCDDRPSPRMAANASPEAWICCTFFSLSCTESLLPPEFSSPHVTTNPSLRMAPNATRDLGSVSRSSAGLARNCCHPQLLYCPM